MTMQIMILCALVASSTAGIIAPATYVAAPKVALASPGAISYASFTPLIRSAAVIAAPAHLAVASAPTYVAHAAPAVVAAHAPVAVAAKVIKAEPIDPNPAYSFSYGVNDPSTGDSKQQSEQLQNGVVQGSYSLNEPDGTVRTVTYTADPVNGFNAVVDRSAAKVVAAKVVAPAVSVAHSPYAIIH